MKIHKEGYKSIGFAVTIFAVINLASLFFVSPYSAALAWFIFVATFCLLIFIFSFFRIPSRVHYSGAESIVSPCDGTVVVIEEVEPDEYFKDKRLQVSIFMSPLNVHVNRNPVSGEVLYSQYHPGKFLVAWHPKSSTENERHSVVYRHNDKEIIGKANCRGCGQAHCKLP